MRVLNNIKDHVHAFLDNAFLKSKLVKKNYLNSYGYHSIPCLLTQASEVHFAHLLRFEILIHCRTTIRCAIFVSL